MKFTEQIHDVAMQISKSLRLEMLQRCKPQTNQREILSPHDWPSETDIKIARSAYSNGMLEILLYKKIQPRGRDFK